MTDRPILFSGPMIRALLEGRKTQTRRVLKLPTKTHNGGPIYEHPKMGGWAAGTIGGKGCYLDPAMTIAAPERTCIWHQTTGTTILPPFAPSDRLWVRETWNCFSFSQDGDEAWPTQTIPTAEEYREIKDAAYRVDVQPVYRESNRARDWFKDQKWRPGIHMPRWASRLTLIVTDVRVQRLQEINGPDAVAEGVRSRLPDNGIAQQEFFDLWNRLHGDGAVYLNPWVAAVTFTVHRVNIDQMEAA